MNQFCVYLTCYRGNLLPPFYIGSSSKMRVENGYHGSVSSVKYSKIWKSELKKNPKLFITRSIYDYNTRKEALEAERRLQLKLGVVRSTMYINQAVASPNGFCGADMRGQASPCFGRIASPETRKIMSEQRKGIKTGPNLKKGQAGKLNGMHGKIRTEDERSRISSTRLNRSNDMNLLSYSRVKSQAELEKIRAHAKNNNVGSGNPRARKWKLTSPQNEVFELHGNFKAWCFAMKLPTSSTAFRADGVTMSSGRWIGWKCERV